MKKGFPVLMLAWMVSITADAGAQDIESNDLNLQIRIRVYNFAKVTPDVIAKGEEEAGFVLEKVGIRTRWLECSGPAVGLECQSELGQRDFLVRILSGWAPVGTGIPRSAVGLALLAEDGGTMASVYIGRVTEIAATGLAWRAQVLGHGIAHEIGHLLMGSNGHAALGIMRAEWKRADLQSISRRSLNFTSKQRKLLREAVHRRETAEK